MRSRSHAPTPEPPADLAAVLLLELRRAVALLEQIAGQQPAAEPLLDAEAVAAMLGTSERAVWGWVAADQLPRPLALGRLRRWRRSEVLEFLERRRDRRRA